MSETIKQKLVWSGYRGNKASVPFLFFVEFKMDKHELPSKLSDDSQPIFIRRTEAKKLFGISPRQLENLAMERKGPPYYRCGKFAIYSVSDFIEWITRHPVKTTNTEE